MKNLGLERYFWFCDIGTEENEQTAPLSSVAKTERVAAPLFETGFEFDVCRDYIQFLRWSVDRR